MLSESPKIRVAVAGAAGKMGREAVAVLSTDNRFEIAALLVRQSGQAQSVSTQIDAPVYTEAKELLLESQPDVWLDFTDASSVITNIDLCLEYGVRPVIGATGYGPSDIARWNDTTLKAGIGGIAAPNFAIGALLMIRFAAEATRFFAGAEIIELHHEGKKDAPSGTALRTAVAMANQSQAAAMASFSKKTSRTEPDTAAGTGPARGLVEDGIHIHSVRLPGLVAHQEIIFGGVGETLTIRHDSLSRLSFMQGVQFACARVVDIQGLVYGLEHLLW